MAACLTWKLVVEHHLRAVAGVGAAAVDVAPELLLASLQEQIDAAVGAAVETVALVAAHMRLDSFFTIFLFTCKFSTKYMI